MDATTQDRLAFEQRRDAWAQANGYKLRGGLWRTADHYITSRRDHNDGPFIAQKTAFKTGAHIADIEL